ncbi:MAG: ATP-dependent DNA ligase [Nanoarchaeota archaeon]|nr:ATP-dependent DNA ligase [Nanoarchaeota archaeon]
MEYIKLVEVCSALESTSKRLEKTYIISEFLKKTKTEDLNEIILLLQGKVFPPWDEHKIGVASRLILKAINKAAGINITNIEKEWAKIGDLGDVAEKLIKTKKQVTLFSSSLTVKKVFNNLRKLAGLEGAGTVNRKISLIAELLTSSKPIEAKYIVRTVLEEMRVGTAAGTLRDSIVWAYFPEAGAVYKDKNIEVKDREKYNHYVDIVQSAYDMSNDFSLVANTAKSKGKKGLKEIAIKVGIPIKVMLGPKEKDAGSALKRVGTPCQAEYKYDGFRLQIHKQDSKITLFTRRLENVTKQFPEVVNYVKKNVKGKSFILDSEAVGFSPKTGEYLPFQNISQRIKRKYDIERMAKDFPVELNIFDCVYYNGKNMIKEMFGKRRAIIEKIVKQEPKNIVLAKAIIAKNEKDVDKFYKESKKAGNEGVMLKKLDAPYKPGARVGYMVKLKGELEAIDAVIIAAEWGEGKRAKWLSSFTLACIDENNSFLEIGKVGTGIKEKLEQGVSFEELTNLLKPLIISQKGKNVKVKPKIVVEVIYEEIQKSPTYSSGYALRFPRVLRLRDDRSPEDATTMDYLEDLYFEQKKK